MIITKHKKFTIVLRPDGPISAAYVASLLAVICEAVTLLTKSG